MLISDDFFHSLNNNEVKENEFTVVEKAPFFT
jgi:hypothetical protein